MREQIGKLVLECDHEDAMGPCGQADADLWCINEGHLCPHLRLGVLKPTKKEQELRKMGRDLVEVTSKISKSLKEKCP